MRLIGRIALSALATYVGAQAAGWLAFAVVTVLNRVAGSADMIPGLNLWVSGIGSAAGGIAAARYVWMRMGARLSPDQPARQGLLASIVTGALIAGTIGFACGFFGPMIVTPGANQGPLLGIFITGPLGFVAGAIGGGLLWVRRE